MVTKVSSTEFENMWNTIVRKDSFCPEWDKTHWATGEIFDLDEIEENKPRGWNRLKKIIEEIEKDCVVYYYCTERDINKKILYFIIYGINAKEKCKLIGEQCNKMRDICGGCGYGVGTLNGTIETQCPLF